MIGGEIRKVFMGSKGHDQKLADEPVGGWLFGGGLVVGTVRPVDGDGGRYSEQVVASALQGCADAAGGRVDVGALESQDGRDVALIGTSWVKLEYADPPQPGDYEVVMYSLQTNTWGALLFDHVSGATWELTDKWNKVGEPK